MKFQGIHLLTIAFALFALTTLQACDREICENSCVFNNDGECDDGGEGSIDDSLCDFGTDCNDCGVRNSKDRP